MHHSEFNEVFGELKIALQLSDTLKRRVKELNEFIDTNFFQECALMCIAEAYNDFVWTKPLTDAQFKQVLDLFSRYMRVLYPNLNETKTFEDAFGVFGLEVLIYGKT